MQYDGGGKLGEAIVKLCGHSPRSQDITARLIKEAKDALGITSKAKTMPDDMKLAIWQWHYDRLNPVQDIKQDDDRLELPLDSPVYNVKQADDDGGVYNVKQVEDSPVYDVKQDDADALVYDFKQVHFALTVTGKRTTVMLEGYLVKALQHKHGLPDNAAVRAWIGQAIKADGVRFDSHAPLTRQVKRLAVESLV